jgi:predicted metal-dependent hydrolase
MEYVVRESSRARNLGITVHEDGRVIVTKPRFIPDLLARAFIERKRDWVEAVFARLSARKENRERRQGTDIILPKLRRGTRAYKEAVERARTTITRRVAHYAELGSYQYGTISIRNQKTRWGSCSRRGNLSFNIRLAFLPPHLVDYLAVHELAHTVHPNHSQNFWDKVGKYIQDPKVCRKELRRYRW